MANLFYEQVENDELALELVKKSKFPIGDDTCYYEYNAEYKEDNFYFGFFAHHNILKLIDEVNNQFTNIKIKTIYFDNKDSSSVYIPVPVGQKRILEYTYILFRVELNDSYNYTAKYILTLAMAEFLRGYCPEYNHFLILSEANDDFINNNLKAQGNSGYGCWLCCSDYNYYECSREVFNEFDNIELINRIAESEIDLDDFPNISDLVYAIKLDMEKIDET